jgi:hypothetical protein
MVEEEPITNDMIEQYMPGSPCQTRRVSLALFLLIEFKETYT